MASFNSARKVNGVKDVEVGDILVATWGYDQTNADFFQVVKIPSDKSLTVRHIKKKQYEDPPQSMSGYAAPIKDSFDGKPTTRRIYYFMDRIHINVGDSMGSAEKWNGKPVAVTWYA